MFLSDYMAKYNVLVTAFVVVTSAMLSPEGYGQVHFHVDDVSTEPRQVSSEPKLVAEGDSAVVSYHLSDLEAFAVDDASTTAWDQDPVVASGYRPTTTWIRGEYLNWWIKGNHLPPLLTTSPPGTPRLQAGVLPGATILLGDEAIDHGNRPGARLTVGHWFDTTRELGIEASWASVFDDANSGDYDFQSPGLPILARPFFDVSAGLNASDLIAYTDPANVLVAEGSFSVRSSSELHTGNIALRKLYREGTRGRVDLIGGYRYLRFREGLLLQEQMIARDGGLAPFGTIFDLTDQFTTESTFHGGDLGFVAEFHHSRASLELLAKVALGGIQRKTTTSGNSTITPPPLLGPPLTSAGGLLALPTNIGTQKQSEFAALPEFGVNLKLAVTDRATLTAGYTLLMLNGVARTGEQIDTTINPTQLSGGALMGSPRPQPLFASSDFWAQGVQFGLVIEH